MGKRSDGFTLIEMMLVVAIIGVMAAMSMPWYMRFQMRVKAAESKANLSAVRTAEEGYFAEYGTYVAMSPAPSGSPISVKRRWSVCPLVISIGSPGHCLMGFFPEGPTYYSYAVATLFSNGVSPNVEYFADAAGDIDGTGVLNLWGIQVPMQGSSSMLTTMPGRLGCTQVYDGDGSPLVRQIGACGVGFGFAIF
jgi:type IV pilus assembly protein PilA